MAKEKFERTKPHVQYWYDRSRGSWQDHFDGQAVTIVQSARGLAEAMGFDSIDNAPEERERGIYDPDCPCGV